MKADRKNNYDYTGYNAALKDNARDLRKNMTKEERHLWYDFLKDHKFKFYRQRVIDRFIADFYCSHAKLVIEIDGSQHYTEDGLERDKLRTMIINKYGLTVIRFSNADIRERFGYVCKTIDETINSLVDIKG